jgi:hypothetical protein
VPSVTKRPDIFAMRLFTSGIAQTNDGNGAVDGLALGAEVRTTAPSLRLLKGAN